jgi:hypothetical protein
VQQAHLDELLTRAEAILVQDLTTATPVFSGAMASLLARTSLLVQLQAVTFDDIAGYWGRPWHALDEVRKVADKVASTIEAPQRMPL